MEMHIDLHHTDWIHELVFPLLFFAVPLAISLVWTGEVLLLTLPLMALAGFLFAPRRLWLTWLGMIALLWAVQGVAALMGEFESGTGGGETIWSFAAESLVFTAVLVLLPLWFGRKLKSLTLRRPG